MAGQPSDSSTVVLPDVGPISRQQLQELTGDVSQDARSGSRESLHGAPQRVGQDAASGRFRDLASQRTPHELLPRRNGTQMQPVASRRFFRGRALEATPWPTAALDDAASRRHSFESEAAENSFNALRSSGDSPSELLTREVLPPPGGGRFSAGRHAVPQDLRVHRPQLGARHATTEERLRQANRRPSISDFDDGITRWTEWRRPSFERPSFERLSFGTVAPVADRGLEDIVDLPDVGRMSRSELRRLEAALEGTHPWGEEDVRDHGNRIRSGASSLAVGSVRPHVRQPRNDDDQGTIDIPGVGPMSRRQLRNLAAVLDGADLDEAESADLPDLSTLSHHQLEQLEALLSAGELELHERIERRSPNPTAPEERRTFEEIEERRTFERPTFDNVLTNEDSPRRAFEDDVWQQLILAHQAHSSDDGGGAPRRRWQIREPAFQGLALDGRAIPEDVECSICCQPVDCSAVALPCNRARGCKSVFHDACLRPWLERNPSCPLCRDDLTTLVSPVSVSPPIASGLSVLPADLLFMFGLLTEQHGTPFPRFRRPGLIDELGFPIPPPPAPGHRMPGVRRVRTSFTVRQLRNSAAGGSDMASRARPPAQDTLHAVTDSTPAGPTMTAHGPPFPLTPARRRELAAALDGR